MIEHFVIMGIDVEEKDLTYQDIQHNSCQPKILSLHPQVEKQPSYLQNYKIWCFPDELVCYSEDLKVITSTDNSPAILVQEKPITDIHQRDILYHFVMTDEKANRRYCTALLFYEKKYVRNEQKHNCVMSRNMPKIPLLAIMRNPLVLDEDTQMIYVPKSISVISSSPTFDPQRQFLIMLYKNFILKKDSIISFIPVLQKHFSKFDQLILQVGLYKTEQMWDQQQAHYDNVPQSSSPMIYIKETHLAEFYVSLLFSELHKQDGEVIYRNFNTMHKCNNQSQEKGKLEQSLIGLLQPSSRSINFFQREVNNEDSIDEILRFRSYRDQFMTLQNFSYKPLLKRLSFVNITKLIVAIIQEQQILFFSSSPGEIPLITESLLSLIRPFSWSCIYIPFSSIELWEYATAIQPYIIGFSRVYKEFVLENIEVTGKVIVDLDDDEVNMEQQSNSDSCVEVHEGVINLLKSKLFIISQNLKLTQKNKEMQWIDAILKTRQAFFGFMVDVVKNVVPHLRPHKERSATQIGMSSIKNIFNLESYVQSFNAPEKPFIEFISKNTMMFTDFVERVDQLILSPDQTDDDSLTRYIHIMSSGTTHTQHQLELDEQCQKCIMQQIDKYMNPELINVYPYLVKYLKYLDLSQLDRVTPHQNKLSDARQDQSIHSHNVLYFFNKEQRKQTRLNLNMRDGLFRCLQTQKLVDLKMIFTQQIVHTVILKQNNSDHEMYEVIRRQSGTKRSTDHHKRQTEVHHLHKQTSMMEEKHKTVQHIINKSLDRPLLKNKRYSVIVKNSFQGRSLLDEEEDKHLLPSFDPKPKPSILKFG